MAPQPDLSSYRLSPASSQAIFTSLILPRDIASVPQSPDPDAPEAILAVGQTGAGKTRLCPAILSALRAAGREPAHLIADVYKTCHPAYASIPAPLASAATGPDARQWLRMAVEEAARRRVDVVLESACRHPEDFTVLASILRDAAYRLTVVVMAVPAPLSRLGTLVRFYRDLPEARSGGLPLRLTPTKVHDDSYEGLSKAVDWLDKTGAAHQVVLLRRGNLVSCIQEGGADGKGFRLGEALARERGRPLTSLERRVAVDDLKLLESVSEAREHFDQIKSLLGPLLSHDSGPGSSDLPSLLPLKFHEDLAGDGTGTRRVRLTADDQDE